MKKLILIAFLLVSAALSATLLTSCGDEENYDFTVAIVQPISHASLDQIRDTIKAELSASGKSIRIIEKNANGDATYLSALFDECMTADVVIPIGTGAAQAAKAAFRGMDTAIVYAAVTDPAVAGLASSDCKNITGVSDAVSFAAIMDMIKLIQPNLDTIGFLYTSSEVNSVAAVNAAKAYCDKNGIAYKEKTIATLTDLSTAVETLAGEGIDAFYTPTDNIVASAMPTYTQIAYNYNLPIYCGADSMVHDGGTATSGVNYVNLGRQVAAMALQIADGKTPSDIPDETLTEYANGINLKALQTVGITLGDNVKSSFDVIVEEDGTSHFGE